MRVKEAENIIKNALRKSANSPYTPDELTAAKLANNKPQNYLDTPDDQKLKGLCLSHATERYGLNVPVEVINRLEQELEIITQNGYSRAYLLAYEVANECKRLNAPYMTRGEAGSSLVAFILGITHTNPLPEHLYCLACGFADFDVDKYYDGSYDDDYEDSLDHCGFDIVKTTCPQCGDEDEFEGDGHNIPFEIFAGLNGEKAPRFEIDVPEELCDEINGFLQGLLTEDELKEPERNRRIRIIGNPILSLFRKLQEQTMVSEDCISIDGVDFIEAFSKGGYKNIPLLEKIPDEIAVGVHPSWFSDIVKLLGLLHGTSDMGKIEEYESDETVPCIIDAISHQEDVMQTLMCFGIERERAYHIMEAIGDDSKTQLSDDDIDEMTKKGISYGYISDLARIVRLYPKAHDTEYAIKLYKLMWYQQNFPEEYEQAINEYRDALESNKSKKGE